ncbi:MAG TPA: squalene/phytoene synthase family protein [Acidimicrobiales bacterium]|nr:squalene/phytoene synthase family protein [Acidimicrobiales bacterium]
MNADAAYARCEEITRTEAKNFSYGIRLLRPSERRAMSALYALARRIDDIGDGDLPQADKLIALEAVRTEVRTLSRTSDDPVIAAVADAAVRYPIPLGALEELIDGCEMDVRGTTYETIDELVVYCRRVAGTVGRLTLAVTGSSDPATAAPLADALGVALQLTNILRDVVEDRAMGRVYLPAADARIVGCEPDLSGTITPLVAYEARRAREWFDRGLQLLPLLNGRGRACVATMAGIYERLLTHIERDPAAVTRGRLSLPTSEKLLVAARGLAGAWR